jgi:prevent-host-death family protein
MKRVSARDANQHFAEMLAAVEAGERVLITKRGRPVAVISPYRAEVTPERQAAIDRMIASMDEPVTLKGGFRTFTRDEMHER